MSVDVRDLTGDDSEALRAFFGGIPAEDRTFFWEDVTDPHVADDWAGDARRARRAAFDEQGRILAFAALVPGSDWSSHVSEVVLVVAPQARRQGLGRALAREMLVQALQRGSHKVTVTIAADSTGTIQMFQGIGFFPEALLRDQLRSPEDGALRDIVVLSHMVDETFSTMVAAGLDGELS
ncbi:MAG TPA: GNAT family N-acetyltransferase [Solirubrobacteraceae bacterium]|jgi:L-amino acid N-acyltransferase YncA|nr:GNAT family N-acetyltransferase [Solirubrobacteraceae bacterium]